MSRRTWLQAAAAVAALALLAVATAVFWPRPVRQVSAHQLAEMAARWADAEAKLTTSRQIRTAEGWSGTVESTKVRGQNVLVFSIAVPRTQFGVKSVPYSTLPSSRYLMAAWQTKGRLYVVVIERGVGLQLKDVISTGPTA